MILVLDPMLATGGSASDAITLVKNRGGKKIKFVSIIGCEEGLKLHGTHPDVQIYCGTLDERLNEKVILFQVLEMLEIEYLEQIIYKPIWRNW